MFLESLDGKLIPQFASNFPSPSPLIQVKMQFTTIAAVFLAALVATEAATLPHEHHARFLAEKDTIAAELAAWKNSAAGRYAKENGLFKDPSSIQIESTTINASDDQLIRFYLSKVTVEKAQAANPEATFSTSTPFSLMTEEEFSKYVSKSSSLGSNGLLRGLAEEATEVAQEAEVAQATTVDWTTSGCVAGVKNQGSCGSCWAFSAIASLESAYCLKYGSLTLLSDQQVTNCDPKSSGCDGGWPSYALSYIKSNGGVCTSSGYPYTSGSSGVTGTCQSSSCTKKAISITSVASVGATESSFLTAITKTPVAVAVAAGNPSWKQYTGGVVSSCSTSALDHAVLAVGYDATSFKLKNQWGTAWGAGGYINLKRISSTSAACSVINSKAVYPVIA